MTAIQIKATVNYFDEYYDEPYRDVGRILPIKMHWVSIHTWTQIIIFGNNMKRMTIDILLQR
jgi:hypothetical protein